MINNQREKVSMKMFQLLVKTGPHPQIAFQIYHLTMLSRIDSYTNITLTHVSTLIGFYFYFLQLMHVALSIPHKK